MQRTFVCAVLVVCGNVLLFSGHCRAGRLLFLWGLLLLSSTGFVPLACNVLYLVFFLCNTYVIDVFNEVFILLDLLTLIFLPTIVVFSIEGE